MTTNRTTDVAGGVTDEELDELYYAVIRAYCLPADKSRAMRARREVIRRFALEQQARGVEMAQRRVSELGLEPGWDPEVDEFGYELRALAERIRKGKL